MSGLLLASRMTASYFPVLIMIIVVSVMGLAILLISHLIGRKRHGAVKDSPYESGVPVIGDARRRFNVKFYIVAVLFLLFDVEIVFLWPWAPVFYKAVTQPDDPWVQSVLTQYGYGPAFLLSSMLVFFSILTIGLIYEWRKGILHWS